MKIRAFCAVACLVAGCATKPTDAEFNSADFGTYPTGFKETITTYLQQVLKDPESAKLKFLNEPKKAWSGLDGQSRYGYAVCVDINAKNSFGAYTGFDTSFFLIRDNKITASRIGDGDKYQQSFIDNLCAKYQ